jgi:hypothetical protein
MAVGKSRTRPLAIGDRRFRWRADFNDPWLSDKTHIGRVPVGRVAANHRIFVRPDDAPNKLLTIIVRNTLVVTPGLVRASIDEAFLKGWLSSCATLTVEA